MNPIKFLHLSDLHSHLPKGLESYGGRIIITGDLTDDGASFEYRRLEKFLNSLNGRVNFTPGNHDLGIRGNLFSPASAEAFDALSWRVQDHLWTAKKPMVRVFGEPGNRVTLIGLNSCLMTESIWDYAQGEIGRAQLAMLDTELNQAEGVKILTLHHHPFFDSPTMRLTDADKLMAMIAGRVDVLLFGHRHEEANYGGKHGIPHILAAPANWIAGHGAEIAVDKGQVTITRHPVRFY